VSDKTPLVFCRVIFLLCLLGSLPLGANAAEQIVTVVSAEAEPYRVAYRAFQEGLAQKRPDVQTQEHVLGDGSQRERILADIRQRRPALVLTLGSAATTLVRSEIKNIPIVFCMVLNPQAAGLVQSMQSSGNNLTGASLDIPVKLQFEALQSVAPTVKRIGVFYNPSETEKVIQPAAKVAAGMGLELVSIPVGSPEQLLQELADTLRSRRLDALWSVADSTVFASNRSVEFLLRRTAEARIPFMGLSPDFVKSGSLLALSVDYKDIGLQCGEQAAQVLQGLAPSSLPITVPRKVTLHINLNVARTIGLRVPASALEKAVVYGHRSANVPPQF
jgi:putative tryptophan/tyrosine transport system substrate-binding protein